MQSHDSQAANVARCNNKSSPTRDYTEKITYLKFLISNAEAGSVIGKGGCTISDIQLQSQTLIQISKIFEFFPGTSDRIIMVSGQIDCVVKAVELILKKLLNETYAEECEDEPSSKVRLVVPHSCCGGIIGRGGSTIKSFVGLSKAGIKLSSQNDLYAGSDRLVTVVGTISAQLWAIDLILLKLSTNLNYTHKFSFAGYDLVLYNQVGCRMFTNMHQYNYRKEGKGNSGTIHVTDEHIGLVLGRGGRNLANISQISEARIKVSNRDDFISLGQLRGIEPNDALVFVSLSAYKKVTITGSQRAIRVAEDMIMSKLDSAVEHYYSN